ncbi:MAG TPA: site-2 protease family protein [Gemmatimonadaceae bacterium]|nr:site-2 protease family protein [Gemmatimonadaceae bacterium]
MRWSWRVGRLFGIGIHIHATFLLLLVWVAVVNYQQGQSVAAAISGVLFILAVFASVVLHELGHALTARRFGVGTRDITLLPIGGVARLERMPTEPKQELLIALGGPAVTLAIAAVLYLALAGTGMPESTSIAPSAVVPFFARLMQVNVVLLLFNMLPAFPMDGGRVLRAALAMKLGFARATDVAARFGKGFALLFAIAGLFWLGNPFLVFIALFVWLGAAGEAAMAQTRLALDGVPVSEVMITDVRTLTPNEPLSAAVSHVLGGFQQDFPVVENGTVVGVLTRADLIKALTQHGPTLLVSDAMQRDFRTADERELVDDAFARLQGCNCHTLPVVRNGQLVGVITSENIGEFMMLRSAVAGRG